MVHGFHTLERFINHLRAQTDLGLTSSGSAGMSKNIFSTSDFHFSVDYYSHIDSCQSSKINFAE